MPLDLVSLARRAVDGVRLRTFICLLATVPAHALAEPQPAVQALMHYTDPLAVCFENAESSDMAEGCVGQTSTLCMDTEEGGYSTVGMMFCTLAEYHAWDAQLNATYQSTMAGLRAEDRQDADLFPEFANRAEALRTAQRAWIAFRDGECALAYAMWGSGSMRQIAGASCLLDMTATRTIELRFLGAEMR